MFVNNNCIVRLQNINRYYLLILSFIVWHANTTAIHATKRPQSNPFVLPSDYAKQTKNTHHLVHPHLKSNNSIEPFVSIAVLVVNDSLGSQPSVNPGSIVVWLNKNQTQEHVCYQNAWFRNNNIALWHSSALMSDLVIILLPVNLRDENMSDLVWSLKSGWKQRMSSGLSRGRLLLLLPITESNTISPAVDVWLNELKKVGLSDVVERIDVEILHQSNEAVVWLRCHPNGSHTLTDRTSFIHVLQETFSKLGGILPDEPALIGHRVGAQFVDTPSFGFLRNDIADTNVMESKDQTAIITVESSNSNDEEIAIDVQEETRLILAMLDDVRNQQEEYLLVANSNAINSMDLATLLDPLVSRLMKIGRKLQPQTLSRILHEVRSVYDQHLDSLGDYFGAVYENILDNRSSAISEFDITDVKCIQDRVINNFRQAAELALIPMEQLLPLFQKCNISFDHSSALLRLETDLCDATDLRKELLDESNDIVVDSAQQARRKRFFKFCKTLAIRTLMLGINYAQGWIALQSIKRMALERERDMPKFPLL